MLKEQENTILLINDPRVLAIPIIDNHEPWVDLKDQAVIAYGPSPEVPNNSEYTKIRKTIYEKLVYAQMLLPKNLTICLYEGYRNLTLQASLFNQRFSILAELHPEWSKQILFRETTKLISPTINQDGTKNTPPHSTGSAVDLYLIDDQNQAVEMGIHPKDWLRDSQGQLSLTASLNIAQTAHHYRQLMSEALIQAGFINYPTEYWHWSYGDRYWAYHTNHRYAFYGTC